MEKLIVRSYRLPAEQIAQLADIAEEAQLNRSEVVRRFIRFIVEHRHVDHALQNGKDTDEDRSK